MRIIAGRFGGRRLPAEVPAAARPTSDRVREGWAAALVSRGCVADASVLDLFAGTGAMGLELLSRGASRLVAVDKDLRAFKKNAASLGADDHVEGLRLDLLRNTSRALERIAPHAGDGFSLVLADPPYDDVGKTMELIEGLHELIIPGGALCIEHRANEPLSAIRGFEPERVYRYGDTAVDLLLRA